MYAERRFKFLKRGYARVSTKGQARDGNSLEAQENALKENGAQVIYVDAYSGATTERPEFQRLLNEIEAGDTLIVTKLDRFARSAAQGIALVEDLVKRGITINVLNMGVLDDTPTGRLIRNIFLCFADFERAMIVQRTQEGKAVARTNPGYREGRKKRFSKQQIEHAIALKKNHSYAQISEMTGISKSTLIRAMREHEGLVN